MSRSAQWLKIDIAAQGGGGTHRLQVLLDLSVKGAGLEGDDLRGGVGVVGDGGAALGAEDAVDVVARRALAGVLLGGAVDGELRLGDDGDEGCVSRSVLGQLPLLRGGLLSEGTGVRTVRGAGLALAVVAVVISGEERGIDVDRVGDGLAEAVSGERHDG